MAVETEHVCYWCGNPAVAEREIVPPVKSKGRVIKAAITAWACEAHNASVDANRRAAELARERKRVLKRIGNERYDQEKAKARLVEINDWLREFGWSEAA